MYMDKVLQECRLFSNRWTYLLTYKYSRTLVIMSMEGQVIWECNTEEVMVEDLQIHILDNSWICYIKCYFCRWCFFLVSFSFLFFLGFGLGGWDGWEWGICVTFCCIDVGAVPVGILLLCFCFFFFFFFHEMIRFTKITLPFSRTL